MINYIKMSALTIAVLTAAGCLDPAAEAAEKIRVRPDRNAPAHFWDEIPVSPSTKMPEKIKDGYWNGQFERVNREVAKARDAKIVFFGDSITWHWSLGRTTGKSVWEKYYADYNPINMGNSGDITPVMLYRVTHGNLAFAKGQAPKVAVLLCGTNNYVVSSSAGGKVKWGLGPDCSPADAASGARAVAQAFRRRLPRTRVIMMAILPVSNKTKWAKCRKTNAVNAALAYNKDEVTYLDLRDKFLRPDGSINRKLFSDGTHLTPEGYRLWADSLKPLVSAMMKKPGLKPVRIMLIGGRITEGKNAAGAYRRYLDGMLRRKGRLIDFVGSRKKHNDNQTEAADYRYDTDHEGHWGKDSQWLAENIAGLLADGAPDVAVINIGTEDIVSSSGAAVVTAGRTVENIGKVIKTLRSKNKTVKIVLANVIPALGKADQVNVLNRRISGWVKANSTDRSPVVPADQHTGFNISSDLSADGVLPNATGAEKMATVFADAINTALNSAGRE